MENKLAELEKKVQALKITKARYEEKLGLLREQKNVILTSLATMNIDPKDLPAHISKLEEDINSQLAQLESQLPKNL